MTDKRSRRNTRQRQVVLEELKNLGSHPTAAELYEIARRRLPKISLGTVYSNLELLAQLGVIRKLQTSGSVARFDGDRGRHYHVCCVRCGRVDDAQGLPTDPLEHEIKSLGGYDVLDYHLQFVGICPECKTEPAPVAPSARA